MPLRAAEPTCAKALPVSVRRRIERNERKRRAGIWVDLCVALVRRICVVKIASIPAGVVAGQGFWNGSLLMPPTIEEERSLQQSYPSLTVKTILF
jgi:hypothetical protein